MFTLRCLATSDYEENTSQNMVQRGNHLQTISSLNRLQLKSSNHHLQTRHHHLQTRHNHLQRNHLSPRNRTILMSTSQPAKKTCVVISSSNTVPQEDSPRHSRHLISGDSTLRDFIKMVPAMKPEMLELLM